LETARLKEVAGIALTTHDTKASVLSVYPASHQPAAAAVVDTNGAKIVFVGAYNLSSDAISRLAAYANAWRVSPPGNVIAADNQLLMIHPLTSGNIEVVLRSAAVLTEMETGTNVSSAATSHTLNLTAGHTYLFEQQPTALLYSEDFEIFNTGGVNGQGSWSAGVNDPQIGTGSGINATKVVSNTGTAADGVATKALSLSWGTNTKASFSFDTYFGGTTGNIGYAGIGASASAALGFYVSGAIVYYRPGPSAGTLTAMTDISGTTLSLTAGKWYNITANFTRSSDTITDVWLTNLTDGGPAVQMYFGANTATRVYTSEAGDESAWDTAMVRLPKSTSSARRIDNLRLSGIVSNSLLVGVY
jgi:hypothetical protein